MARTTPDAGIAELRALTLRSRLADATADPAVLLARAAATADPDQAAREVGVFPVAEQALWTYLHGRPRVPFVAIYPPDGLVEADYPLALSPAAAADPARRDLATRLAEWFRSPQTAQLLADRGFRPGTAVAADPGGPAPAASGLARRYPAGVALPADGRQIQETSGQWVEYRRSAFQVLLLVDASAAMNDKVRVRGGGVTTKADLLRRAGAQAAQLFGDETSVAMWVFATPKPDGPRYVEVVPYGPVVGQISGVPRRTALAAAVQQYRPYPGAGTPLYEAVLHGTAVMRERTRPGATTLVVVLTGGRDTDEPSAADRAAFLDRLAAARDPARPVPVFCIGYGADADMATLAAIARLTGGQAVASSAPDDLAAAMARIFLAAHQMR